MSTYNQGFYIKTHPNLEVISLFSRPSKFGSMDSETETGLYNGKNDYMPTNEDGYISAKMENITLYSDM